MNRKKSIGLGIFILLLGFLSCKHDSRKAAIERMVKEWTGKQIQFPDDFSYRTSSKDTALLAASDLFQSEYKILLYVDSAGCSSCRLKLPLWQQLIEEADSLFKDKLSFLFFFQPKNKKELEYILRTNSFNYPIFIDMNKTINHLNRFPDESTYQCFLLDKNNKVLMIGNPSLNPKIWELYKQQVSGKAPMKAMSTTSVSIEQSEIEINDLHVNKKSVTIFKLKNTGKVPLLIARVDASCGCTVPSWEKKPVKPGEETDITLEIQPEETGFFHKTVQVYCNVEKEVVSLSIKGMVK